MGASPAKRFQGGLAALARPKTAKELAAALEVTVDGATIPMVADCAGQTAGWAWTVPYAQIELCGQTCSNFAAAGQADLFADCGC